MTARFALTCLISLGTVACTAPGERTKPQRQIERAEKALGAARLAEAETYAAESLNDARTAFGEAMEEVRKQDGYLSSLLRSYANAEELLEKAQKAAIAAEAEAKSNREEARKSAVAEIEKAQTAIDDASGAVTAKPNSQLDASRFVEIRLSLAALKEELEDAKKVYSDGQFEEAAGQAASVSSKAGEISAELEVKGS